jgi:hypothetical protein
MDRMSNVIIPPASASAPTPAPRPRGAPVWIETHGYLLRSFEPSDITPEVFAWLSGSEMLRGLNLHSLGTDIEGFRKRVAGSFDNISNYIIGIYRQGENRPLGFYSMDILRMHKVAHIAAGLGPHDGDGREIIWATMDALLDHFYVARDIDKITARVLAKNFRILYIFKDNPRLLLEGVLKKECLIPDGRRIDILVFSSFRGDGRKPVYDAVYGSR